MNELSGKVDNSKFRREFIAKCYEDTDRLPIFKSTLNGWQNTIKANPSEDRVMKIVNRSFAVAFAFLLASIVGPQTQTPAAGSQYEVVILNVSSTVS